MQLKRLTNICLLALVVFALGATPAAATPWINGATGNPFHWARTANPFTVKLGNDVGGSWSSYLNAASTDWSATSVTDFWGSLTMANPVRTTVVGGLTTGRKCRATNGRVEVCSAAYGRNGWLGLASVWASGDHITQATVKLNDTYFGSGSAYNTPTWRAAVACQEIGHAFGLDHQDESGANLHTCMDYASVPNSWNMHPNRLDYDTLVNMNYAHLDLTNSAASTAPVTKGSGLKHVRDSLYVEDLGNGTKHFVWVVWTDQNRAHKSPPVDAAGL